MPLTCWGSQPRGFITYGIGKTPHCDGTSTDCSRAIENDSRCTGDGQGRDHADLEAEDGEGGGHREHKRPDIETCEHRRIERERKGAYRRRLTEHRVDGEPDGEIEDDA